MKRIILTSIFLLIFNSPSFSDKPQELYCKKTTSSQNQECAYKVQGQITNRSDLYSNIYTTSSMPYALCSKALCTINKTDKEIATCVCDIYKQNWKSASVGPKTYNFSKPTLRLGNLKTVTSNFSLANTDTSKPKSQIICKSSTPKPWANCYGAVCQVNQNSDNSKATCQCPINKSTEFESMGINNLKDCNTPSNQIWSAATPKQVKNDLMIMNKTYLKYYPEQFGE